MTESAASACPMATLPVHRRSAGIASLDPAVFPPGQQTRQRPTGRSRECPLRRSHRHRYASRCTICRNLLSHGVRGYPDCGGNRFQDGDDGKEPAHGKQPAGQPGNRIRSFVPYAPALSRTFLWLCNPAKYPGKGNPSGRACFQGCHPDLLQAHDYLFWFTCLWVYFFCIMSAGAVVVEKGREDTAIL